MKSKATFDPYAELIERFNKANIQYAIIGASGINYYSRSPETAFATLDYDLFINPTLYNLKKAIKVLGDLGYSIAIREGKFSPRQLHQILRQRQTLIATDPYGIQVELLLEISGYTFEEIAQDAATFAVNGIKIKVGKLHKLLRSKKIANRPKDRLFLKRYEALLKDEQTPS